MSKASITWLFFAAAVAVAAGLAVALGSLVAAIAGGVVTIGGPSVVTVDGEVIAESLPWLLIAALLAAGGSIAAVASWIGSLLNTWQLDDKTWFVALLALGLVSLGWIATFAYVIAGPDAIGAGPTRPGVGASPAPESS